MKTTDTMRKTVWEDAGAICMARVVGVDGVNIVRSNVTSIQREIFDLDGGTPGVSVSSKVVVVSDSVFNSLQTDGRWSEDSTGYNFRDTIIAGVFSTGGHSYSIEYKFTPSSGEAYWLQYEFSVKGVRSS